MKKDKRYIYLKISFIYDYKITFLFEYDEF